MPLKVLLAGCSEDERARLESLVRRVLGTRAEDGAWTVSLVKVAGKWSVHLDGPHEALRGVSCIAAESELHEALLEPLRKAGLVGPGGSPGGTGAGTASAVGGAPPSDGPQEEQRDRYNCARCKKAFAVVFPAYAGEARANAPVACPHCWQLNQVPVGQWAAAGDDYRAEKE